jgi:hypothetical protein
MTRDPGRVPSAVTGQPEGGRSLSSALRLNGPLPCVLRKPRSRSEQVRVMTA